MPRWLRHGTKPCKPLALVHAAGIDECSAVTPRAPSRWPLLLILLLALAVLTGLFARRERWDDRMAGVGARVCRRSPASC